MSDELVVWGQLPRDLRLKLLDEYAMWKVFNPDKALQGLAEMRLNVARLAWGKKAYNDFLVQSWARRVISEEMANKLRGCK